MFSLSLPPALLPLPLGNNKETGKQQSHVLVFPHPGTWLKAQFWQQLTTFPLGFYFVPASHKI